MQLGRLARQGHDLRHGLGFQQAVFQRKGCLRFARRVQRGAVGSLSACPPFLGEDDEQKSRQDRAELLQQIQNFHKIIRLAHKRDVQRTDDLTVEDERQGNGGGKPHRSQRNRTAPVQRGQIFDDHRFARLDGLPSHRILGNARVGENLHHGAVGRRKGGKKITFGVIKENTESIIMKRRTKFFGKKGKKPAAVHVVGDQL